MNTKRKTLVKNTAIILEMIGKLILLSFKLTSCITLDGK